jgi:hypothetical protein
VSARPHWQTVGGLACLTTAVNRLSGSHSSESEAMTTASHLTRQILAGAGTPARELADALALPVVVVQRARRAQGRCAELGHPPVAEPETEGPDFVFWDAVMRSNRSVCG